MGRIPSSEGLARAPTPNAQPNVRLNDDTRGLQGLTNLAKQGAALAGAIETNRRTIRTNKEVSNATNELLTHEDDLKRDTDFDTQEERYRKFVVRLQENAQKTLRGDGRAQKAFIQHFDSDVEAIGRRVASRAKTGQLNEQRSQASTVLDSQASIAANYLFHGDQDSFNATVKSASQFVQTAADDGIYTSVEAGEEIVRFMNSASLAEVQFDLQENPGQAIVKLRDGRYGGIKGADRVRWMNRAKEEARQKFDDVLSEQSGELLGLAREGKLEEQSVELDVIRSLINSHQEQGLISEDVAGESLREIELAVFEQQSKGLVENVIEAEGVAAGYVWLDEFAKVKPDSITPDEHDQLVASLQIDINRASRRKNIIEAEANKKQEKEDRQIRGQLFTDPNIPVDPRNKEHRKDVSTYFDQISSEWQGLPLEEKIEKHIEFVSNTGILPDALSQTFNASMRSGDAAQVSLMADIVGRIQEGSPQVLADLPAETRVIALQVSDALRVGMAPAAAIEVARKNAFGLTTQDKQAIKLASESVDLNAIIAAQVDEVFDPGIFSREPEITPAFSADYKTAFDKFMLRNNGNVDQSSQLALDSIRRVWGVTKIGGTRLMRYAPEAVYSVPGFDNDWIQDQFDSEMEAAGIDSPILGSDMETPRKLTYPVLMRNSQGLLVPARDHENKLIRWQPDFTLTSAYKNLQEIDLPAQIEKAKALHEKRKKFINRLPPMNAL